MPRADTREQQRGESRQKRRASGSADRGDSKRKARSKDKATETDAERGLKRDREEEQVTTYRRCRLSRHTNLRDMLAGPRG